MESSPVVHFGPFTFDRARLILHCGDRSVPVGGRAAAILARLAQARGDVVTRSELLDAVWPGLVVEERNLTVQVATLRKVMGELSDGIEHIGTVSRVGYRLICDSPRANGSIDASIHALRPSVAVLPFANLTTDPEMAFFARGVTEDIIAALSRFRTFALIARGASMTCQDRADAALALGVRYVVEGSVQREGRRLRVGARLTNTDDQVIWAEILEDEIGGLFDMQDRIVALVVNHVAPGITKAEIDRSRRKHPENLDAYDHFIQGLAAYHGTSAPYGRNNAMIYHFDRAVALDPSFPQALAYAGMAHDWQGTLDLTADHAANMNVTLDLCDRAEAMAGDDALVMSIAAVARHGLRDDGEGAMALARRAVALNPHSHDVLDFAATVFMLRDRPDEAGAMFRHCLRLAPGSPQAAGVMSSVGFCHLSAGQFDQAIAWESRAQSLQPNPHFGLATLIAALAMDDRVDDARQQLEVFLAVRPGATIAGLMESLPKGSRAGFSKAWGEGLRRAGLRDA